MPHRDADDAAARWSDRLLDGVLALLAAWTLAYHLCLLLKLNTTVALAITAVALAAFATVERLTHGGHTLIGSAPAEPLMAASSRRPPDRVLLGVLAVGATVAAVATATDAPWVLVWVPWLLAAAAAAWWALRHLGDSAATPAGRGTGSSTGRGGLTALVVIAWSLGAAVLAACLLRSNPDDLYYLNLSQWVADHGTFPLRDTIYANLTYPMSNWPPLASYDALVGTAARLAGVSAGSVEYVAVPPIASALSVLALWRLLRAWRVERVAYALSVALVFLLFNGALGYGNPGSLFVSRLWQGKVVLLCVVVPVILARSAGFAERPSRRGAAGLLLAGSAAVSLSTTALFLVPVLGLAGAVPLVRRTPRWALVGFLATSAYALVGLFVTLVVDGRSADDFGDRRLYRFDPAWVGHEIFLTGPLTLVTVACVVLAAVLIPHPAARLTSALLALVLGVVLSPNVMRVAYDLTGLGPTLWRLSWGCSIAALVGAGAVRLTRWAQHRLPGERTPLLAGVLVPVLLVVLGEPVWEVGSTSWTNPAHWKRSTTVLATAHAVLDRSERDDVVLAPDSLAIAIAVNTTEVKTVSPRAYYMAYLRHDPTFHYDDRMVLERYANGGSWRPDAVRRALRVVGVRTVCVSEYDAGRGDVLGRSGYVRLRTPASYRCWQSG